MADPPGALLERAFTPAVEEVIAKTTDPPPTRTQGDLFGAVASGFLMGVAAFADEIPKWGFAPSARDAMLRQFITEEPIAASAFATICARDAAFSWKLNGGPQTSRRYHEMLHSANFGKGWENFIKKLRWNVLTQDKGGFVEAIRSAPSPDAPVIGLQTLDPASIHLTGDPLEPVLLWAKHANRYRVLKWWQVYQFLDQPVDHAVYSDLQLSALSRALLKVQIWRNIDRYTEQKTGGQFANAIHVLSGVGRPELEDAMADQLAALRQANVTHFRPPVVMATLSENPASLVTLEFASIPDGFDKGEEFKQYITILAMALQTDYQELAPLSTGALGSAMQSATLDDKAKRKGAANFRKSIAEMMNHFVLPGNVEFEFDEKDLAEQVEESNAKKARAETRGAMLRNGEIDPAGARQMAFDDGDLSEELFYIMNARDLTLGPVQGDARTIEGDARQVTGIAIPAAPSPVTTASGTNPFQLAPSPPAINGALIRKAERAGPDDERLEAEEEAASAILAAMRRSFRDLREHLLAEPA